MFKGTNVNRPHCHLGLEGQLKLCLQFRVSNSSEKGKSFCEKFAFFRISFAREKCEIIQLAEFQRMQTLPGTNEI